MTPVEIEALIAGIALMIQLINQQIATSDKLTEEEKAAFIARIKAAQASVPDWE
jgi:hypothetical protein